MSGPGSAVAFELAGDSSAKTEVNGDMAVMDVPKRDIASRECRNDFISHP